MLEPGAARALQLPPPGEPGADARNEDLWLEIRRAFTLGERLVNLNNGGVSPAPAAVQEELARLLRISNEAPAYTMWKELEPGRETVRERLADVFGASAEEIALVRNASEGLQICQLGFDLEPGDRVLTTTHDYPRMLTTFAQRARREGIVLDQIELPVPAEDDDEVVRLFERGLTDQTRLVLVSHMVNITGQILPVGAIVRMARARGIPVIVDGAHTFAHFPSATPISIAITTRPAFTSGSSHPSVRACSTFAASTSKDSGRSWQHRRRSIATSASSKRSAPTHARISSPSHRLWTSPGSRSRAQERAARLPAGPLGNAAA